MWRSLGWLLFSLISIAALFISLLLPEFAARQEDASRAISGLQTRARNVAQRLEEFQREKPLEPEARLRRERTENEYIQLGEAISQWSRQRANYRTSQGLNIVLFSCLWGSSLFLWWSLRRERLIRRALLRRLGVIAAVCGACLLGLAGWLFFLDVEAPPSLVLRLAIPGLIASVWGLGLWRGWLR